MWSGTLGSRTFPAKRDSELDVAHRVGTTQIEKDAGVQKAGGMTGGRLGQVRCEMTNASNRMNRQEAKTDLE